jgi:hypothetical protein
VAGASQDVRGELQDDLVVVDHEDARAHDDDYLADSEESIMVRMTDAQPGGVEPQVIGPSPSGRRRDSVIRRHNEDRERRCARGVGSAAGDRRQ